MGHLPNALWAGGNVGYALLVLFALIRAWRMRQQPIAYATMFIIKVATFGQIFLCAAAKSPWLLLLQIPYLYFVYRSLRMRVEIANRQVRVETFRQSVILSPEDVLHVDLQFTEHENAEYHHLVIAIREGTRVNLSRFDVNTVFLENLRTTFGLATDDIARIQEYGHRDLRIGIIGILILTTMTTAMGIVWEWR